MNQTTFLGKDHISLPIKYWGSGYRKGRLTGERHHIASSIVDYAKFYKSNSYSGCTYNIELAKVFKKDKSSPIHTIVMQKHNQDVIILIRKQRIVLYGKLN